MTCHDESHPCFGGDCLWAGSPNCGGCDIFPDWTGDAFVGHSDECDNAHDGAWGAVA